MKIEIVVTAIVTIVAFWLIVRLHVRRKKASPEELRAITEVAAFHVMRPHVDHAELLYDEYGLPK